MGDWGSIYMIQSRVLESYQTAGEIVSKVRDNVESIVKGGKTILEICDEVEGMIKSNGGKPAFPCNVSINEVAAHYTSPPNDGTVIPKDSVVKVDIGVHVDGYIADTAITVCLDPELEILVQAAKDTLKHAINVVRHGIRVSDISSIIEKTIKNYGLKPIRNLTGHHIKRYIVHTQPMIPNVAPHPFLKHKLEMNEVYAIEPFVTTRTADGWVKNLKECYIYQAVLKKPPKSHVSVLYNSIKERFHTLPFALRWLQSNHSPDELDSSIGSLIHTGHVKLYHVLAENSEEVVAQAEHTILVTKYGCKVLTA